MADILWRFPAPETWPPMAAMRRFSRTAELVEDDQLFACAGIGSDAPPVYIPCVETIMAASGDQLCHLKRSLGHYGYTMGYCDEHGYCPPQNRGRTNVVLLADMPSLNAAGRVSANHCGWGQNCLFEDGHIGFVCGESIGEDAIFVNDYNLVAPGCRARRQCHRPQSSIARGGGSDLDRLAVAARF